MSAERFAEAEEKFNRFLQAIKENNEYEVKYSCINDDGNYSFFVKLIDGDEEAMITIF